MPNQNLEKMTLEEKRKNGHGFFMRSYFWYRNTNRTEKSIKSSLKELWRELVDSIPFRGDRLEVASNDPVLPQKNHRQIKVMKFMLGVWKAFLISFVIVDLLNLFILYVVPFYIHERLGDSTAYLCILIVGLIVSMLSFLREEKSTKKLTSRSSYIAALSIFSSDPLLTSYWNNVVKTGRHLYQMEMDRAEEFLTEQIRKKTI